MRQGHRRVAMVVAMAERHQLHRSAAGGDHESGYKYVVQFLIKPDTHAAEVPREGHGTGRGAWSRIFPQGLECRLSGYPPQVVPHAVERGVGGAFSGQAPGRRARRLAGLQYMGVAGLPSGGGAWQGQGWRLCFSAEEWRHRFAWRAERSSCIGGAGGQ